MSAADWLRWACVLHPLRDPSRISLQTGQQGVVLKQLSSDDPRARRIALRKKAILVTSDGNQLDVVVTDISEGGFRLQAEETFYDGENIVIGEPVTVRLERRDDVRAEIVWAQGCEAGCVFLEASISKA